MNTVHLLYDKINKERIAQMNVAMFKGRIIVVITEKEADKAVAYLSTHSILGFDTETRPAFHKGEHHRVALLQISTDDVCFLFRLNRIGFPNSLIRLLSDSKISKIGLSLQDDLSALRERGLFEAGNFIELQDYVRKFGIEDQSLRKIYANVFGEKISKRQQRSNWDADILSPAQQMYAAIDAWACLQIYKKLESFSQTGFRVMKNEM